MIGKKEQLLKLAHSVASLSNRSAGPTYSVPSLANKQSELGADVAVHSLGEKMDLPAQSYQDIRHPRNFSHVPLLKSLGFSYSMKAALSSSRYDVVHTHGMWLAPNTYRSKESKFVIAPRGMLTEAALSFSPIKKKIALAFRQGSVLESADLFHATSEAEFESIREFGIQQPVAIIPNGIDIPNLSCIGSTEPNKIGRENHRRKIISLGRIHPKKGLDRLINAWKLLENTYEEWDLEIVGPNQNGYKEKLQAQAHNLGLTRVHFRAPIHGVEKVRYMSSANLFILPSLSENFGMTVAESLALSVPVIATKGTPWSGLSAHRCGWWVDSTPSDLAGAMNEAMKLPARELESMGARGQQWMQDDFSWDKVARMSLDTYAWLLGRGEKPNFVLTA